MIVNFALDSTTIHQIILYQFFGPKLRGGYQFSKEGGKEEMTEKTLGGIFNNPFEDVNANVMNPKRILDFWCNPFTSGFLKEIGEKEFYTSKMPIILEGSRGSGKTTILKYFSSDVQFELSKKRSDASYTKQVKSDGGVGIYFRCDESFIKTFQIIFNNKDKAQWSAAFEHYLELFVVKNIFEIIERMDNYQSFETNILNDLKTKTILVFESLEIFKNYIIKEILYIDAYKNNAIFNDEEFKPEHIFSLYQISGVVIEALKKSELSWKNINFMLLIDEFENLNFELQKMFNTLMKFSKNSISFRIGRRSEGLITTETINETEYLREKHDYKLISLLKDNNQRETKIYFEEIAKKRFKVLNEFEEIDVSHIFGQQEDLDWEAGVLAKDSKVHIYQILKTNSSIASDDKLLDEIVKIIQYPENSIAEMLNALWVIRNSNKDKLEVAKAVKEIMLIAFNRSEGQSLHAECPDIKKYKNDYKNKYRYSLVVAMSSIYRKRKLYYSFNTICYLSNSNVRMFINFCRTIINDALFYERKDFLATKKISPETQSRAIYEVSQEEFNNVCAIIKHGQKISNLVQNIGNVLADFHKDKKVRYPETNQFFFDYNNLGENYQEILNVAMSWAVILKKQKKQRASPGINKTTSIYHLNRAYAPIFNISYRTRGGYNVDFTAEEMEQMCESQFMIYKIDKHREKSNKKEKSEFEQIDLFEWENQDD